MKDRAAFYWLAAVIAISFIFLQPLLASPFVSDESFNSYYAGFLGYEHLSLVRGSQIETAFYIKLGRFFPINTAIFSALFFSIRNVVVFKALQITAIITNVVAFWFVIVALGRLRTRATLASIMFLLTLQFTTYYNATVAFDLLLQLVTLLFFVSILCTIRYCATGSKTMLAFIGILTIVNGFTYEVSYAFAPILVLIAARLTARHRTLAIGIVSLGSVATLVLVDIAIRANVQIPSHTSYSLNLSPFPILSTIALQITATLPLIYVITNPLRDFANWSSFFPEITFGDVALVIVTSLVTYFAIAEKARTSAGRIVRVGLDNRDLRNVGVAILVLPSIPTSLSARYQTELQFGFGYLPVYFAGFGCAILLTLAIEALVDAASGKRLIAALATGGIVMTLFITNQANKQIIAHLDATWGVARRSLERSLQAGILDKVPEHATIVLDRSKRFYVGNYTPGWNAKYLLYQYTHRRFDVASTDDRQLRRTCRIDRSRRDCLVRKNLYSLTNDSRGSVTDVVVAHLTHASTDDAFAKGTALTDAVFVYASRSALPSTKYTRRAFETTVGPQSDAPILARFDVRRDVPVRRFLLKP